MKTIKLACFFCLITLSMYSWDGEEGHPGEFTDPMIPGARTMQPDKPMMAPGANGPGEPGGWSDFKLVAIDGPTVPYDFEEFLFCGGKPHDENEQN